MIDLKLSKKERKQTGGVEVGKYEGPDYPWGFTLNLETDQIKKLGIGNLEAGTMVALNAVAKVTEIHVSERDKEKKTRSMTIQIQKVEISPEADAKKSAAKKMRKEVADEVFSY